MINGSRMLALSISALTFATPALAAPDTMRAIVLTGAGGVEMLHLQTVPVPQPAAGEVRIRIVASAVNPTDVGLRKRGPAPDQKPPVIPGQDVSGFVDAIGVGVTTFKVGDPVVASLTNRGGYAEYVVSPVVDIAIKPKAFTFEQAAGIPTAGVAGWRAIEQAKPKPGQRIAIIGAAGGVGSAATQFAKAKGAHIIGIGSEWQDAAMKELGADEVVNYDKDNVAAKVGMVDIVINTVAGERETALTYVKKGGTLVSVVGLPAPDKCMSAGVTCITFSAQEYPGPSKGQTLPTMAKLADSGQYHVDVEKTFPLDQAAAAQTASEAHTKGKIVLIVGPESKQK